jgi:hypothetical protein
MSGALGGLGIGLSRLLQGAEQQRRQRDQQINQLLLSGFERTREPQGGGIGDFFRELLAPQGLDPTEFTAPRKPPQVEQLDPDKETVAIDPNTGTVETIREARPQTKPGFTLRPGESRFDGSGNKVASLDPNSPGLVFRQQANDIVGVNPLTGEEVSRIPFEGAEGKFGNVQFFKRDVEGTGGSQTFMMFTENGPDGKPIQRVEIVEELAEAAPARGLNDILKDLDNLQVLMEEDRIAEGEFDNSLKKVEGALLEELKGLPVAGRAEVLAQLQEKANAPETPNPIGQAIIRVMTTLLSQLEPIPIEEVQDVERETFGTVSVD